MAGTELLIVFVKAPRVGEVKTRLALTIGAEAACAAYRRLTDGLLTQLEGLPRVELCFAPDDAASEIEPWRREEWTLQPQGFGDLGVRLSQAFASAFARGASRVVVIGSDCPDVTVRDVRDAWTGLDEHDVVIGPARDGGYWLIGLKREQPALFERIPWSTADVFTETLARAHSKGLRVQVSRELADVDTETEWREYLARERNW